MEVSAIFEENTRNIVVFRERDGRMKWSPANSFSGEKYLWDWGIFARSLSEIVHCIHSGTFLEQKFDHVNMTPRRSKLLLVSAGDLFKAMLRANM